MTIGIDASRANKEQKTGTEWYSYLLIEHLKKVIPSDVAVRLYTREPLKGELTIMPPNWEERVLRWPPKYLWTLARLSWEMLVNPPDLLFIPAHGLPLILPKSTVATIHDIGFERFPELYRRRALWYHRFVVRRALKRASAIIAISEWTKKEIESVFKNIKVPIHVIPLAHDEGRYHDNISIDEQREVQQRYNIQPPYFFFIGRLEKKKNIVNIVSAFLEFSKTDKQNYSLVLVGPRGYGAEKVNRLLTHYEDKASVKPHDFTPQRGVVPAGFGGGAKPRTVPPSGTGAGVKILNWIPESDIPALMAGATALVFPSFYEGFGIPILEAMAVGTPVITSNVGAAAEVAGAAALLVDPYDIQAISRAMQTITSDQNLRDKLHQAGFEIIAKFSWRKTAEATWEVLCGLLT